ncbi:ketoreductase [Sodiomyces alkalinus F11]|uniref:Ketoreductase n=1 Tax=Sodiomyces alkalinus (strain CBS 110278 / VKM F-3762 / F11) TaxID=1314773 RepID=A0A3N2Q9N8_SODAK|nr:ketoreductase [Sodiomyces alkalinus F11]ROT43479.1 ketoreductase [Sodiomyces alkalinus F11]
MTKILLTGGSGFIAAHILEQLLEAGHQVVTTVRSEEKAQKIRDAHKDLGRDVLDVVIVPDIAREDAFDEVVKTPGLEAVLHTASPFHYKWTDPLTEVVNPAVIGTTGILKALHRSAPSVKRVVITSSFASILDETRLEDPSVVFSERTWNPVTIDDIHRSKPTAYRASKTLAERAAWDFVDSSKPSFDLVTICPPLVLGPVIHHLASLDAINTSNERVVALARGDWKSSVPETGPPFLWIDVRDVALAHLRALERPEAGGGHRLFATAGRFCNAEIAKAARENFPELKDRLPGPEVTGGEYPPADKLFNYDSSETNAILGIDWIPLEKSIVDLIKDIKAFGI